MNWRSVVAWWVVASVLVGVLAVWERLDPAAGVASRAERRAVFTDPSARREGLPGMPSLPEGDPVELTIRRHGAAPLRFTREQGGLWRQVEPVEHPVEGFSIERTLRLVRGLEARDVITASPRRGADADADAADPSEAALLGLEPPRAEVEVRWAEAAEPAIRLLMGRRGIGGRAYARVADDPEGRMLVVDAEVHDRAVVMDPREWRDRTIFGEVSLDTAESISIEVGALRTVMVREDRQWRLSEPYATRVNPLLLEELVNRLTAARVNGFVIDDPEDPARFGLAPRPEAEIRVRVAEPGQPVRETRLRIGAAAGAGTGDRYGIVDDRSVLVRVPGALVQSIARVPAMWADPTASGVRPLDVGRMRLLREDPGMELVLERVGEAWTLAAGDGVTAPGESTPIAAAGPGRLLELLTEVRAPGVRPGRLTPSESTTVVLEDFGGRPLHAVRVGRDGSAEGGGLWIMDAGDGLLRLYPAGIDPPLDAAALAGGEAGSATGG